MTRPPLRVMALGHSAVVAPVMLLGIAALFACWQNPDVWPLGLLALFVMNAVIKANGQASAYRRWKQAWDDLADVPPARRRPIHWRRLLWMALAGGLGAIGYLHGAPAAMATAILVAMPVLLVIGVRKLWRRQRRQPAAKNNTAVAICIGAPIHPVPPLADAYRRLPDYAQRALGGGR